MFLDVRDLTITLKTGEEIAKDISFSIDGGEMLSIVGSSGAGKTTVCKAVMGLLSSNYSISGEVLYRGENLLHCSKKRLQAIYGKEICYIMQNPMTAFNPSLRIGRQLEKTCYLHNPQISRQELQLYSYDIDRANQLLDEAGYIDTDGDGIREKDGEKLSSPFQYQAGSASDDNLVVYICDQLGKIGIELTPQSAQMMDWYAMITTGEYGLTLFKTQGGFYDPGNTIGNIDPSMAMDPIISQVAAYLPGGADLITELESTTDEERIQEIYGIILTTMADQCLTTPLVYPHQLAVYSDKIANYDFPPDANFTAVQNITLK